MGRAGHTIAGFSHADHRMSAGGNGLHETRPRVMRVGDKVLAGTPLDVLSRAAAMLGRE